MDELKESMNDDNNYHDKITVINKFDFSIVNETKCHKTKRILYNSTNYVLCGFINYAFIRWFHQQGDMTSKTFNKSDENLIKMLSNMTMNHNIGYKTTTIDIDGSSYILWNSNIVITIGDEIIDYIPDWSNGDVTLISNKTTLDNFIESSKEYQKN